MNVHGVLSRRQILQVEFDAYAVPLGLFQGGGSNALAYCVFQFSGFICRVQ